MKNLITALALVCAAGGAFAASHAAAAPAEKMKTPQQEKMAMCNKDAEGKKGDERKTFMKSCLGAKPAAGDQKDKMKMCNKDADGKKGDERKAFMKECLSKKA